MFVQSKQDISTDTDCSKLSAYDYPEDDEWYTYIEITERLLTNKRKIPHRTKPCFEAVDCGRKRPTLPMRRSLFEHVPPFIIFENRKNHAELPTAITRHLLWWRGGKYAPQIIVSTVRNSGFRMVNSSTYNWCGTWCSTRAYSKLKSIRITSKASCFPSCMELGDKIALWRNYRRMSRRYGGKHFDYMPYTFILPEQADKLRKFMRKNDGFWIVKPPASCAGCGIKVVTRLQEIPERTSLVAQRYVCRPRLINGIKFDIRLYVLLTSIDPLRIYLYKEGLVRLATVKYANDVETLSNRFMHLTNTSINKFSPDYKINDDPNECKGNMWSLKCLWKYLSTTEKANVAQIWNKLKDIAVKTMISVEVSMVNAWRKTAMTPYNFYQLFGLDVLLDEQYRPWLLEVNDFPSMEVDTPLCKLVKGQLAQDCLNLVGFHVPNLLSSRELRILRTMYNEIGVCYNRRLYSNVFAWKDRQKQYVHSKMIDRGEYLKSILRNLTSNDVRVLIRHEDEITRTGDFEIIFPTSETYKYLQFFEKVRYYNLLLDAWENKQCHDRSPGIEKLRKLCKKRYHLS